MLRFYGATVANAKLNIGFQYISCYGSMAETNTHKQCTKISIHLMLRFYGASAHYYVDFDGFQYISCYGSMHEFTTFLK